MDKLLRMWINSITKLFSKTKICSNQISRTLFFDRKSNKKLIELEKNHAASIYSPLPTVLAKGQGCKVWDADGKEYLDFLGGYAALNTGHCHPKILATLKEQASTLHHTSRAVYNDQLPIFSEYITKLFKYDKVIPTNTGVEGGDCAIKMARRWGYLTKNIPENEALVVFVEGNFWGRSLAAISSSTKLGTYQHFGPFMPGFGIIPFDNLCALEQVLCNPNVCAFMMEPILGEGGIKIPSDRYLTEVRKLCTKHNVLWIADEIQTGLGRTGAWLAVDHECVRPDILVLGKGLAGGFVPVSFINDMKKFIFKMSAVLANDNVMCHMTPGTHGTTFGGNPLASGLALKTLQVIQEECLIQNAKAMGDKLRSDLTCKLPKEIIPEIRGKGLLNAIVINPEYGDSTKLCYKLLEMGMIAKGCDEQTVRLTPPLVVTDQEICQGVHIISEAVHSLSRCSK